MRKNKLVFLLLVLVLIVSMSGCGASSSSGKNKEVTSAPDKNEAADAESKEATSAPDKNEAADAEKNSENKNSSPDKSSKDTTSNALPVKNSVIFDQDGFKVTTLSLEDDEYGDKKLNVKLENSSDQDVTFQVTDFSVNGYMASTLFSVDVKAGSNAEDAIAIYMDDLKKCGIEEIETTEFKVFIFNTESYATIVESGVIALKTGATDSKAKPYDASGKTVYDDNNIKIVAQYVDDEAVLGQEIVFYIENNADKDINVSSLSTELNGNAADALFNFTIASGKKAVTGMSFTNFDGTIKDAKFSLEIINSDTTDVIADTDTVSLSFE